MAEIPRAVLSEHFEERLRGRRLVAAVFLTFRFDPEFFEQEVLPVFLNVPVSHAAAIKLVQLEDGLRSVPGGVAVYYDQNGLVPEAGPAKLDVQRIPVRHRTGIFHPKNVFALVEEAEPDEEGHRARSLMVASTSANLTRAGWWENVEVCHVEEIDERDATRLRDDVIGFLKTLEGRVGQRVSDQGALREIRSFLRSAESRQHRSSGGVLHTHFYDGRGSVADFLADVAGSRLHDAYLEVISPYFDTGPESQPLAELIERFTPREVRVCLPKNNAGEALCSPELFEWVRAQRDVSWGRLPGDVIRVSKRDDAAQRMVHAKVYRFFTHTPKREILFVGSANLTEAAHQNGGNLETGFLVELSLNRRPDWWLISDVSRPKTYAASTEEGASTAGGSRLSIRFNWARETADAFWDDSLPAPVLTLSVQSVPLFTIDALPSREWSLLGAEEYAELRRVLASTSILMVEGGRNESGLILVQEEGMEARPSLLFDLSPAETELKRRLDDAYDAWLIPSLRGRLPEAVWERFDVVVRRYRDEKTQVEKARRQRVSDAGPSTGPDVDLETDDRGGTDTFFAWFFRGEGPKGIISGANIQGRFIQAGTTYSTFFEDNYLMDLLGARPGEVATALSRELGLDSAALTDELGRRGVKYLSRAKRHPRADRMRAAQAAALELLRDNSVPYSERARIIWHERFENIQRKPHALETQNLTPSLEHPTFFTELRKPKWAELRALLWSEPDRGSEADRFREQELRGQLLASVARLGHSLIDMYVLAIQRLGSIDQRAAADEDEEGFDREISRVDEYLDLLDGQRKIPLSDRSWAAFDELEQVGGNFELILDVNAPDARTKPLRESARYFGSLLRQQQPVGGMFGQVNRTVIQQFRMPGYPFVLISTDLLQEGEDLHTFCSAVHHYGIAWTPSSMEQRIGRIDRVRSQTDRRLSGCEFEPSGTDLLQVYYPHLEDTVEVLQVQRVLERMNTFLRLMHEGLSVPKGDHRSIDVSRELANGRRRIEVIRERLKTAFPVPDWALQGNRRSLATGPETASALLKRFERLAGKYEGLDVVWEPAPSIGKLLGTVRLSTGRIQPFTLLLKSDGEHLVVRCVSPVGQVGPEEGMPEIEESAHRSRVRIGAILGQDDSSYDLTVEDDVLLGNPAYDAARVGALLRHVAESADTLERVHLEGQDQPLSTFEADLKREGGPANV